MAIAVEIGTHCCRWRIDSHDNRLPVIRTGRHSMDGSHKSTAGVGRNLVDRACRWLVDFLKAEKGRAGAAKADRARKAKSRFLESTSNDMRQDLQTLTLLGAVMRKIVADPKALEICKSQDEAVANLGNLLNSILEFYELESGAVEPHIDEARIQDIFQQLQEEFAAQARTKRSLFRMVNYSYKFCEA